MATAANLCAVALVTAVAARRLRDPVLTAPNLLTLGRAGAAALLCGTAVSGRGRRVGFWALLVGCTLLDWLDGPLARRLGPTRLGALLDIEADTWLTFWGAAAGVRLGRLPGFGLVPPVLRYLAPRTSSRIRPWQQAAGVAQMVVIAGALSPWRPPGPAAGAAAVAQLAALSVPAGSDPPARTRPGTRPWSG